MHFAFNCLTIFILLILAPYLLLLFCLLTQIVNALLYFFFAHAHTNHVGVYLCTQI